MPIYEYRCLKCRHEFGQLIRSSDEEKSLVCPKCGKKDLEKKLSVFAARDGGKLSRRCRIRVPAARMPAAPVR